MIRFRAGRLALLFTSMLSLLALTASVADAAEAEAPGAVKYRDEMTFIGDSVTAGFGYCGYSENAKNINCKPNDEMRNNWYLGDNSLKDCAPPDGGRPTDACSNNNLDGQPWLSEPWEAGADSPNIAYPFQIAARQTGPEKAEVSDWALTGSTPADWDPDGGAFGNVLGRLKNQYVGMTLGANPLLSYFTNIDISIPFTDVEGPCVDSTGYKAGIWGFRSWYAGPIDNAVNCLRNQWNKIRQTQHLVRIYTQLLEQNDRVVVLGYYRDCSWSFGNWQPKANPNGGPASGNSCKSQTREISRSDSREVSQWDQATAVGSELNNLIQDAVIKAKERAKKLWPYTNRDDNLVYTQPDNGEWEDHQPKSDQGSWVLLNDTWIHPNKAGAGNLATTVTDAMCSHFGHWCGEDTEWNG